MVFAHADIVHLSCRLENDSVADPVAHLLRRHAGAEYCQSCLARLLHSTYEQIAKAVTALRMTSRYRVTAMATEKSTSAARHSLLMIVSRCARLPDPYALFGPRADSNQ